MGIRASVQKNGLRAKNKVNELRTSIKERDGIASKTLETAEEAGKATLEGISKVGGWVISKSAKRLGADKYRDELDAALQEALRVITVQEERIALLESQVVERD
jgi:hypothetical protein